MNNLLEIQRKIVPEALVLLEKRYSILNEISLSGTIGRRMLASKMNISERIIRSEVDFLKNEGLIAIDATGMMVTPSLPMGAMLASWFISGYVRSGAILR